MENGQFTVEELGAKFGVLLAQHIAENVILAKQNTDLADQFSKLLTEYNQLQEENERLNRITGPVGHK